MILSNSPSIVGNNYNNRKARCKCRAEPHLSLSVCVVLALGGGHLFHLVQTSCQHVHITSDAFHLFLEHIIATQCDDLIQIDKIFDEF